VLESLPSRNEDQDSVSIIANAIPTQIYHAHHMHINIPHTLDKIKKVTVGNEKMLSFSEKIH
jgi:hypothetical protein